MFEIEIGNRVKIGKGKPTQQPKPSPTTLAQPSTSSRPAHPSTAQFGPLPSVPGGSARAPLPLGPRRVPKPRLHPPRRARSLARGPRPTLAHLAAAVSRLPHRALAHAPLSPCTPDPSVGAAQPAPRATPLTSGARLSAPSSPPSFSAAQRTPPVSPEISPARPVAWTPRTQPLHLNPLTPCASPQSNRTPPATLAHRPSELRVEQSPHAAGKRARHHFSPPPATQSSP